MSKKIKLNYKQKLIATNRYLILDNHRKPRENVEDMFTRISKFVATNEKRYQLSKKDIKNLTENFYKIQSNFEFLSGFTLSDRGRNKLMAACYVLPLHDSLESIYKTLYQAVRLHRLGAGIGYDFSEIRPECSLIKSTGKEASGPISFMRLYDFSSEIILNRGSVRHAGHMGILRIDHPDIQKFIRAKENYNQLTNFNLSVAVTDKFIKAYKNNKNYKLKHPKFNQNIELSARNILKSIAKSIHKSGEPGIIFIDEINRKNTLPKLDKIKATNLCGEQPLLSYEACNLGSIALNKFLQENKSSNITKKIDWKRLERVIRLAVRFLDNTIDIAHYELPEIKQIVCKDNRKIGLGVMGWADLLSKLSIPYDSNKALKLAEKIMRFIQEKSREESCNLGKLKGNFNNFKKSIFPKLGYKYMRNATITTIAPTGTISLFADCNGGIEPFFSLSYVRKNMETLGDKKLVFINKYLEKKLKEEWVYSKNLMKEIIKKGNIQKIKEIPGEIKSIFKTALEINPIWHLKMQASFQKYTDNSVSKTINLPENTDTEKIEKILIKAYELNLKGVTIYRNKSRDKQVLNLKNK